MMSPCRLVCLVALSLVLLSTQVQADMYEPWWEWSFVENASGGGYLDQISLDLAEFGDQVDFTFSVGDGPSGATITGIYFEDGTLLGLAQVVVNDATAINGDFDGIELSTTSKNLPGGKGLDPKFEATSAFSVDVQGVEPGVSPGESVTLRYDLQSDQTFAF